MTNTMDSSDKKPKKKHKGPIRIEAILPIIIITALFIVYFSFFFDNHLRKGLEFGATYANKAEVNISHFRMNWRQPGIDIGKIQVTNRDKPTENSIEIEGVDLVLLWDALLRGKFIIPESSIVGIATDTLRAKPGRVLPLEESKDDGLMEKTASFIITKLKERNSNNILGDIIDLANGTNYKEKLKTIEAQLKSKEKIIAIKKDLKIKEEQWKKRINELPKSSELKKLSNKIKKYKFNTTSPQKIKQSLKDIQNFRNELVTKYKSVNNAKQVFSKDISSFKNIYSEIENAIKADINDLAARLNIPTLDANELSKMFLAPMIGEQLAKVQNYKNMVRKYVPKKTKEAQEQKELTPHERAQGKNYKFLKNKSYPLFWLQNAVINSKANKAGNLGDLTGTINNVTNAPKHLGIPMTINFKGEFPRAQVLGLNVDVIIDHTKEVSQETAEVMVGSFPLGRNMFTESKDINFGFKKALGKSKIKIELIEQKLKIDIKNIFTQINYITEAQSKKVQQIIENISKKLNNITLNIKAGGTWSDFDLKINSNLGNKVQNAIKGEVQAQIRNTKKDIENHVRGLIKVEKDKINKEINKIEQKYGVSLKSKAAAIQSVEKIIDNKKKELEAKVKNQVNERINKEKKKVKEKLDKKKNKLINDLKSKFKF